MLQVEDRIDPLRAQLPSFSVDWRFLLSLKPHARLLVLTEKDNDLSEHFSGLGVEVLSGRVLAPEAVPSPDDRGTVSSDLRLRLIGPQATDRLVPGSFDAIAIPFGLPDTLLGSHASTGTLAGLKRLLRPGGMFLLGFSSRWGILRKGPRLGIVAAPTAVARALREAGFAEIRLYGAAPNLDKPAYIFPLNQLTTRFFLRHRFLGRRGGTLVGGLPFFPALISMVLPGYFIVAGT